MPIMTYRGEKTIGEIAEKMFEGLTAKQKEKVEIEILKANPHLRDPSKVGKGTILKMPDMAELRPKTSRALENPDALLAKNLADALAEFGQRFELRSKQAASDNKQQLALLKNAVLKRTLDQEPMLKEMAGQIAKSQEGRGKALQERQKAVDLALQSMRKELIR